jgi:hypothetical protein
MGRSLRRKPTSPHRPHEPADVLRGELASDRRLQPGLAKAAEIIVEVAKFGGENDGLNSRGRRAVKKGH